ncbi:MAG: helix-turn-helix domain-containing protein [Dissulfurispiraceae bacterium]
MIDTMIAEVRKLLGFTQNDLAEQVGVTQNYYAVIESNPTKSAPLMQKLSKQLKISEQFLAFGDRSRYPFLAKFYTFYLDHLKPFSGYDFLNTNICRESSFVDLVFFLNRSTRYSQDFSIICFAMRDEHDTIFLVTSKGRRPYFKIAGDMKRSKMKTEETELANIGYSIPRINLFKKDLYKHDSLLVYEKTVIAPDPLYSNLANGKVSRKDVAGFFPDKNYFKLLYEAHKDVGK